MNVNANMHMNATVTNLGLTDVFTIENRHGCGVDIVVLDLLLHLMTCQWQIRHNQGRHGHLGD